MKHPRQHERSDSCRRTSTAGSWPRSAGGSATAPDRHEPEIDARALRAALGRFATGVTFITAAPDDNPAGLIVNSFTSVSLEPPLAAFCPSRSSLTWSRMRRAGRFGVNVLGREHERFVARAARPGADRFVGLDWEPGCTGVPLLTNALACLECEIAAEHPAGDHWIVIGDIRHHHIAGAEEPLIFYASAFRSLRVAEDIPEGAR